MSTDDRPKTRGRPRSFDRNAALERAMLLFWHRGYEATSISDLTAAMGITPPSLYAAFGDKERLFLEAVGQYRMGPGNAKRILSEAGSAREAVERILVGSSSEMTCPDHPPGCMVVLSALNVSDASAHVQAALAEVRRETEAFMRTTIASGVEAGELPADTDVDALAKFFMTIVQGMTIQAKDGATTEALLSVARMAMRAWPSRAKQSRTRRAARDSGT